MSYKLHTMQASNSNSSEQGRAAWGRTDTDMHQRGAASSLHTFPIIIVHTCAGQPAVHCD